MNQDKLYVGIDVSSKNNVCYLMYSDGSKHSSFSVPNIRNGAKIIVDRVTSVLLLQDIPQVVIGMEATPFTATISCVFFVKAAVLDNLKEACICSILSRSRSSVMPIQIFRKTIMLIPTSLLTTFASAESIRRSTWTITSIRRSKCIPERVTSSAGTDTGKAAFSEHCFHKFF